MKINIDFKLTNFINFFFIIISDGPISVFSSSNIIFEISFGLIEAYKSPFSLIAL